MPDLAPSTRPGFALPSSFALVLAAVLAFVGAPRAAAAASDAVPDRVLAEGWTVEGYIDPAAGEGQRAQVALDPDGAPIAVWANRATNLVPFEIVWSRFDGAAWSPATRAFAPSPLENQLPRLARAADGALWLAWLQFDDRLATASLFSSLVVARRVDGAWAAPETVATGLSLPNREFFPSEFAVHAVSRDEAWVVFAVGPQDNPFSLDRDLYSARYAAGAWGPPILVSNAGLAETRPEITTGPGGRPVVFFGFQNAPSVLWAKTWTGSAWEQGANDELATNAIFEHAVQPDTAGAVRMVAFVREPLPVGEEDHVREYVWNEGGFHPGPIVLQAAVVEGAGTEPPEWRHLSLATSSACNPPCAPNAVPRYRVQWTDFSPGHLPYVLSAEREPAGYKPLDSPGSALLPDESYPNAAWDPALARWYAVWTAPPTTGRACARSSRGPRRSRATWPSAARSSRRIPRASPSCARGTRPAASSGSTGWRGTTPRRTRRSRRRFRPPRSSCPGARSADPARSPSTTSWARAATSITCS